MKPPLHLDTHVVAWLYAGRIEHLSGRGKALIDERPLYVSAAVELELTLLHERGTLRVPASDILGDLGERIGLEVSSASFSRVARKALTLPWATDPIDRLICAEAELAEADLLTKDATIHSHFSRAVW